MLRDRHRRLRLERSRAARPARRRPADSKRGVRACMAEDVKTQAGHAVRRTRATRGGTARRRHRHGQARTARHRRDAAGRLREDQRDLREHGTQGAGQRRRLLDLRLRPLQGLRRVRHRVRRPRGAEDGGRDRGAQRQAHDGDALPEPARRHAAEVPRLVRRDAAAGLEGGGAEEPPDGAVRLRRPGLGRRRVRRLRREERAARRGLGDGGLHAAALPRQGRAALASKADATRPGTAWRRWTRSSPRIPRARHGSGRRPRTCCWASAARPSRTPTPASPRAARSPTREIVDAHRRRHAAGCVQPPDAAGHRRAAGQRHVRDGHGRAHRLQHGLRQHAAQQPAPVPLDELALPGRGDGRVAVRRELRHGPLAPLGDSRAARGPDPGGPRGGRR